MYAVYEKVIQHLEEHDVKYMANSEDHSVYMDLYGTVGAYQVVVRVNGDARVLLVYGRLPVRIPPGARSAIAETITRANFDLVNGRFDMDYESGDLQFQVTQILSDDSLEDDIIERMIRTTIEMLDTYMPAVLSVVYGNERPQDAIGHIVLPPSPPPCDDEGPPEFVDDVPF